MKKSLLFAVCSLVTLQACSNSDDNNKSLNYESLNVNFNVKADGFNFPGDALFGIAGTCVRDGEQDIPLTVSGGMSRYRFIESSGDNMLQPSSEDDFLVALKGDSNFSFCAVYPWQDAADISALPAEAPEIQQYNPDYTSNMVFTANEKAVSVIPDIELWMKTPFTVLRLSVPLDIVEEGKAAVLKSIELSPSEPDKFPGAISGSGKINANTGEFTADRTSQSIRIEFPGEGLELKDLYTSIPVVALPFTVPEGGFDINFEDVDGNSNLTSILAQSNDAGKSFDAGTVSDITVTRSSDGVVPVTFPVVFPLGKVDNVFTFTKDLQPEWVPNGYWSCQSQPQAYCQWTKVSEPSEKYAHKREIVNSSDIASPGLKGIWTGDYFEFTIPVKKFAAGTVLNMKFPIYGRQEPVFWNIKYLDGDVWKTAGLHNETAYDASYSMECTFSMKRGGKVIEQNLEYENPVKSGYLKIRLECADGTVQADTDTKCAKRDLPWITGGAYGAPFYFYCSGSGVNGISFSIQ